MSNEKNLNLGLKLKKERKLNESIKYLLLYLKKNKNSHLAYYKLASIYLEKFSIELALENLNLALEIRPNHAKSHLKLGIAYYYQSNLPLAEKNFKESIRLVDKKEKNYVSILSDYCFFLIQTGEVEKSLKEIDRVIQISIDLTKTTTKKYGYPFMVKANILYETERFLEAIKMITIAIEYKNISKKILINELYARRAHFCVCCKKYKQAEKDFEIAFKNLDVGCFDSQEILYYKAQYHIKLYEEEVKGKCSQQDHTQIAKELLLKCLKLNPNNVSVLNSLGNLFYEIERYYEAEKYVKLAINIQPKNFIFHRNLAEIYKQRGLKKLSIQYHKKVIQLKEDEEYSLHQIGVMIGNSTKQNIEEGIHYFTKAISVNSKNYIYFRDRGELHFLGKNFEEALSDYNESIKINPEKGKSYLMRSFVYNEFQMYNESLNDLLRSFNLKPKKYLSLIKRSLQNLKIKSMLDIIKPRSFDLDTLRELYNEYDEKGFIFTFNNQKPISFHFCFIGIYDFFKNMIKKKEFVLNLEGKYYNSILLMKKWIYNQCSKDFSKDIKDLGFLKIVNDLIITFDMKDLVCALSHLIGKTFLDVESILKLLIVLAEENKSCCFLFYKSLKYLKKCDNYRTVLDELTNSKNIKSVNNIKFFLGGEIELNKHQGYVKYKLIRNNFENSLRKMYNCRNKFFCKMKIISKEGNELMVHKEVLKIRSEYFNVLLSRDYFVESTQSCIKMEVSKEFLEIFLKDIYFMEVKKDLSSLSKESIVQLLTESNKYLLFDLEYKIKLKMLVDEVEKL